jgi:hypothetical protein
MRTAPACRDVRDVQVRARQLGQHEVAGDHDLFRGGGLAGEPELGRDDALVHRGVAGQVAVFRMADDGRAEGQGVLHGAAVQLRVHHALAVVGKGDAAGLGLLGHLGELGALEVLRHRADRVHAHDALDARARQDVVGDRAVVVDGERIGHAAHRGEPARRRRARAARDRLLVLVPGLAQVDVHVDQPGAHHLARRVDRLRRGRLP